MAGAGRRAGALTGAGSREADLIGRVDEFCGIKQVTILTGSKNIHNYFRLGSFKSIYVILRPSK